jgi:hypothetical protein
VIRVEPQPEPADFDERVRRPGNQGLAEGQEARAEIWRRCLSQLWEAYGGICSYLAVRIPPGTGARSVDHLAPRSKRPELTYEWSNFRLVCSLMNSRKGAFEDVLDPCEIEDGWFTLELSSLEVLPHPDLKPALRKKVESTIERLKLNDPECVAARAEHYDAYLEHQRDALLGLTLDRLRRWSPFVAKELTRQGLVTG